MRINFLGAAGEVTGSCYLIKAVGRRFLVDCGLFQGGCEAYWKNLAALSFDFPVRSLDFVIATHVDQPAPLRRLSGLRRPPRRRFVVHGESLTYAEFAVAIRQIGWPNVDVPEYGEYVDLE